jgi:hypothetical protein
MRAIVGHSAVRGVVLALIVLSTLGYTSVIQFCTMSRTAECCCADLDHSLPRQPHAPISFDNLKLSCNVQIVAGGLTPVAMDSSSDHPTKGLVLCVSCIEPIAPVITSSLTISLLTHSGAAGPPVGDLYLRSGALLI